jgi:hypothetical protein
MEGGGHFNDGLAILGCEITSFLHRHMKMSFKIATLLAVLAFGSKAQADGLYAITFSDAGAINVGSGQINVENGFAVSGYFNITSGILLGAWNLTGGTAAYPGFLTSPSGAFNYNNAVYLGSNPEYPAASPFLDQYGLLFTDASGDEFNFWGNSDGTYTIYGVVNGNRYNPQTIGVATITVAPEPANLATLALLLVPAGVFLRRKLQSESCTTRS